MHLSRGGLQASLVLIGVALFWQRASSVEGPSFQDPQNMDGMPMPAAMGISNATPGIVMRAFDKTYLRDFFITSKITVTGWTDGSYTASSVSDNNLPLKFNYRANGFLLQQNWLRIDRAAVEPNDHTTFGFRSDWIVPGSDYQFTLPRGILNNQLTARNNMPITYGIDPVQFFVEMRFPGLLQTTDFKLGRFNMIHGVEMNEAPMNMLASHNYTYPADPFTHTGLLATVAVNSQWTAQAGVASGSDIFLGAATSPTLLSGIRWTATDTKTSLAFFAIVGSGRFNQQQNFDNRQFIDMVFFHRVTDNVAYTAEMLLGEEHNIPVVGSASWWGFPQYLTVTVSEHASVTARVELFNDPKGNRTGTAGLYTSETFGINYRPTAWLILRPEVRYDYNKEVGAFEGKRGLFTATADAIVRW